MFLFKSFAHLSIEGQCFLLICNCFLYMKAIESLFVAIPPICCAFYFIIIIVPTEHLNDNVAKLLDF